ncbi:hypothetical protein MRX96_057654 [Rhipicephalus microplus]
MFISQKVGVHQRKRARRQERSSAATNLGCQRFRAVCHSAFRPALTLSVRPCAVHEWQTGGSPPALPPPFWWQRRRGHHFLGGVPPETNNARRGEFIAPETGAALHLRPLMSSLRLPPLAHRSPPRGRAWSADEADPRVVVARARWLGCGNQRSKQNTNGSPPGRSAGPARRGLRACPKQPRVPCRGPSCNAAGRRRTARR